MSAKLALFVVTPESIVVEEEGIEIVVVKTPVGSQDGGSLKSTEMGIMSDHAPMLARLSISDVRYTKNNKVYYFAVAGGFLQVINNVVTISSPGADIIEAEAGVDAALTGRAVGVHLAGKVGRNRAMTAGEQGRDVLGGPAPSGNRV